MVEEPVTAIVPAKGPVTAITPDTLLVAFGEQVPLTMQ